MKTPAPLALALLAVWMSIPVASGCAPTQRVAEVVVDCNSKVIQDAGREIVIEVTTALTSLNYIAALNVLAQKYGLPMVSCVVRSLTDRFATEGSRTNSVANGRDWLSQQRVVFK